MAKVAQKYLKVDPWKIIEEGFHPDRSRVSESIFSLANEYMGCRGYFEEGYSGDKLIGSYINGVYEEKTVVHPSYFVGFSTRFCFMVNTVDWLYTRITIDGETLDPAKSKISDFVRCLDMKAGTLTREFIWETKSGKKLKIRFLRFISMVVPNLGCQEVVLEPLNFSGKVDIQSGLDFSIIHEIENTNFWSCIQKEKKDNITAMLAKTQRSRQQVFTGFVLDLPENTVTRLVEHNKYIGQAFSLDLHKGTATGFKKMVVNYADRTHDADPQKVWDTGMALAEKWTSVSFEEAFNAHINYWADVWNKLDITIEGDEENQQGVRFCIFNLHQTYHGQDHTLNVGAKGLTGEHYYGWTWWDTETYCLPFYLFNNPKAAKSLLEYRYATLPQALERAVELDCKGACYPMGTIDGTESCPVWQHGNLEIHVSAAIPYGIWHYVKVCNDKDFLYNIGIEILLQSSRYFASRGQWNSKGEYGFYGVMGADEFHMMVHNNTYTNVMAKKTFEFTLQTIAEMRETAPEKLQEVFHKVGLKEEEIDDWKLKAEKIRINFDKETGLFEQHDGYFDLPHIDVKAIPATEFPLYKHWAYDRIFRTDMIKQPDVLLLMFFFSQEYSLEMKRVNYEYYEPRCSHESSLSPAIHSILAAELGKHEEAYEFARYASRLDLDDYNRNTHEGLHITSMAATWMNIVYGFGGMRSDGDKLVFKPSIPKAWNKFSFKILYRNSIISVTVEQEFATFKVVSGPSTTVKIYDQEYTISNHELKLEIPAFYKG